MTTAAPAIDPARCPLCGQGNRCAMELEREIGVKQPPCWCTQVDFQREVLQQLPAASRGIACICRACATKSAASVAPAEPAA
ncbi:MAG: cysteine-rich CWC family protein [Burkholderiales bacterium]|nr:cysteine-rich CWC family protein [Burkholderiales bacterium]